LRKLLYNIADIFSSVWNEDRPPAAQRKSPSMIDKKTGGIYNTTINTKNNGDEKEE